MSEQETPKAAKTFHSPKWAINLQGDISFEQISVFRRMLAERGFHAIVTACEGIQVVRLGPDLPSVAYRPELTKACEGAPKYFAKYGAVLAEGPTPSAAMAAFDEAWHKAGESQEERNPEPLLPPLSHERQAQLQNLAIRYDIIGCEATIERTGSGIVAHVKLSEKLAHTLEVKPSRMFSRTVEAGDHDIAAREICNDLHKHLASLRPFA